MTDERMALLELVEKSADLDLVREMLAFAADRIMDAEVEAVTGAAKGARSALRETHRNGYRERDRTRGPAGSSWRSRGVLEAWLPEAGEGRGRIIVPAGAIAGLDGPGAHRIAGLDRVIYTSIKPPAAWRGTPAEEAVDLNGLEAPFMFFEGSAREAALGNPKNANLAATVGLAGLGLDATLVRLVANPAAAGNTGIIEASGVLGTLRVEQSGPASENPKTSASTAYSLAHALRNVSSRLI